MSDRVRIVISAFVYYSGLVKLLRWWKHHSGRSLIILSYHSAAGENLRSQWLYLRRHYRILHLEAALEELRTPTGEGARKRDRRTLLAITFDDGYYDNYTDAFTLASELQVPITIFLIPGYIDGARSFWWADRLIRLAQVDQVAFEGRTYHLDQQEERKALAETIDDRISNAGSVADREQFLISVCQALALPSSAIPEEEPAPLLTWAQVREMEESGWVSFGAHTIHHPDLEHMLNPAEVEREVGESRTMLEQQLGHSVSIFAYPHGHIGDHGLHAVKVAGYKWALTVVPGLNTGQGNPYLLCRGKADADMHVSMIAAEAAGVWIFFSRVKRIARFLFRPLHRTRIELRHSNDLRAEKERIL